MRLEERGTENGTEPILVLVFRLAVCFLGQQGRASVPLMGIRHSPRLSLRSAGVDRGCRSQAFVGSEFLAPEIRKRAQAACIRQDQAETARAPRKNNGNGKRKSPMTAMNTPHGGFSLLVSLLALHDITKFTRSNIVLIFSAFDYILVICNCLVIRMHACVSTRTPYVSVIILGIQVYRVRKAICRFRVILVIKIKLCAFVKEGFCFPGPYVCVGKAYERAILHADIKYRHNAAIIMRTDWNVCFV